MKKISRLLLFVLFVLGIPFWVLAQENKQVIETELEIIAEVDIFDSSVVSQNNHDFIVDFTINNGRGVQSDIRYSVKLMKVYSEEERVPVYFKVYDDNVTLAENSKVYKKISVKIPTYIDGEYEMWLLAENTEGLPLGVNLVGKVNLKSSNSQHIEIDKSTCKFFIEGKKGEYYLSQGVDVSLAEELKLSCIAESSFSESVETEIYLETFRRTIYGEKLSLDNNLPKISFGAKEKKEIVLTIPKPQNPQAYSAILSLKIGEKKISNLIEAQYVIQGESASIANLQLDKSQYVEGEKALASFIWSLAADSFPESRSGKVAESSSYYSLSIKSNQKDCATPIDHQILKREGATSKVTLEIKEDCMQPMVAVAIEDVSGKVLAKKEYNFTPNKGNENVQEEVMENKNIFNNSELNFRSIALIIIGIITLIGLIVIVGKVVNGRFVSLFIFLVLGMGVFMVSNDAKALTAVGSTVGTSTYACGFGLNSGSYNPGSTITASVSNCSIVACKNEMRLRAYIAGELKYSGSVSDGNGGNVVTTRLTWEGPATKTLTAPSTCGGKSISVEVEFDHLYSTGWKYYSSSGNLGYNVVNCCTPNCACAASTYVGSTCPNGCGGNCDGIRQDGACGSTAKVYEAAETVLTGAWCSVGTESFPNGAITMPGYGLSTANWTCSGVSGGNPITTCHASRKLLAPTVDLKINGSDGPVVSANRDNGDNLDFSWNVAKNTTAVEVNTYCDKNGLAWGTGQIIPPKDLTIPNNTDNDFSLPGAPYPKTNIPHSLTCQNRNGNAALNSLTHSETIGVSVTCNLADTWSGCPKECGLPTETESCTRTNLNCTTSACGVRNCNYDPCPVSSELKEVKP